MSSEHHTTAGTILKAMKDEGLHIVQNGSKDDSVFTLHRDDDNTRVNYGPWSIKVLQHLLDGGHIKRDTHHHDELRPIFRLSGHK